MVRLTGHFIIISAFLLLSSCYTANKKEERRILAAREFSNQAIKNKDTAALASVWTTDYHVVTSRNSELPGRIANRDRFAKEFSARPDVIYIRTPENIQVFEAWGMASETGHWTGRWTESENGLEEQVALKGTYFAKWHRIDGKWMIRAEIFVPLHCRGERFCSRSPI